MTKNEGFRFKARELRIVGYLLVLGAVAAWKYVPRPWHPTQTLQTTHHTIYSTASPEQTRVTAGRMMCLYEAYSNGFYTLPGFAPESNKLQLRLYKNRDEFRRINRNLGWAEAFYKYPCSYAYYSTLEANPYHWMLHESTHQLNREVAHLKLAKWMEEGIAEYFSTSLLTSNKLEVGKIDRDTYPIWWLDDLATAPTLKENLANGSVIPLKIIITNEGGPNMNKYFNLYYLHWWSLTYFIFESPQYRDRGLKLAAQGGSLSSFEQLIGPVNQVERE